MPDLEYAEARQRKQRSEAIIAQQGLPVLEALPCLAPLSAIRLQAFEAVIARTAAAACITYRCDIEHLAELDEFLGSHRLFHEFTADEKQFYFSTPELASPESAGRRWMIESCHALFWALGHIRTLSYPDTPLDSRKLYHLFFAGGLEEFRAGSRLRSAETILDAADLYFRYLAMCRRAYECGDEPPGMLSYPAVRHRYATLSWLLGQGDWDDLHRGR